MYGWGVLDSLVVDVMDGFVLVEVVMVVECLDVLVMSDLMDRDLLFICKTADMMKRQMAA